MKHTTSSREKGRIEMMSMHAYRATVRACGEPQPVFSAKGDAFLSRTSPCIVCMNDKFPPAPFRADGNRCWETIITVVLGINCPFQRASSM
jgi:hypothetical protein